MTPPKSAGVHAPPQQPGMGGLYVVESSLLQFSPRPGDSSACSGDNLNCSKSPFSFSDIQPTNFANVEDMLFEVFRCEETDTINNIAIAQFLKVQYSPFILVRDRVQSTHACTQAIYSPSLP